MWKKSIIRPIPKNNKPKTLNDYRPVALTSIVMKCLERIVLKFLLPVTDDLTDPMQFAYKRNRGTDDATMTLLHMAHKHLDMSGNFVRILYVDFSSAFNTIQPHLLAQKLSVMNVNSNLILWIVNFLVGRSQQVLFQSSLSSSKTTSTGAPQGTVLSPFLFTLYTDDCRGSTSTPLIKFSDDSAIIDLSNNDEHYFSQVAKFVKWCEDNFLTLNVKKTKEMLIDFRRKSTEIPVLNINDEQVERVQCYKYLGVMIDENLNFDKNANYVNKKCQSRIYLLQKLRKLNVNKSVLQLFYRSFTESILTYSFICWHGSLGVKSKNALDRVVNVCSKIVGVRQNGLSELFEKRVKRKGRKIVCDKKHMLSPEFELLPSGRRFRMPKLRTARALKTFVPLTVC